MILQNIKKVSSPPYIYYSNLCVVNEDIIEPMIKKAVKPAIMRLCQQYLVVFAALIMVTAAQAQLSGTYTINPANAASSSNYTSFNDADSDLTFGSRANGAVPNGKGVKGPVIFNVADGVYNEQDSFCQIAGTSPTNTITFQSASLDSSKVIWTYPASPFSFRNYTVLLENTSNVIFKSLTLQRSGSDSFGIVVNIHSNSAITQYGFLNNRIIGVSNNSPISKSYIFDDSLTKACVIGNTYPYTSKIIFKNNYFKNGYRIDLYPIDSTFFEHNILDSTSLVIEYQSLYAYVADNIVNNAGLNFISIRKTSIINNRINNGSLSANNLGTMFGDTSVIANNMIIGKIKLFNSNVNVFYNNILTLDTSKYISTLDLSYPRATKLFNNNIINKGNGNSMTSSWLRPNIKIDYNNFYTAGKKIINSFSSLAAWRSYSSYDSNSISINPKYISNSDLHVTNDSLNVGLYLASFSKDFDGQSRHFFNPTIGSDEIPHKASSCMSGTYFIGRTSADYISFRTAINDLIKFGVCGPVVFNVADGIYNESFQIDSIIGASSTNTITFQSISLDSSKVILDTTWSGTSVFNGYAIKLNNAKYLHFRKLTISNGANSYSSGIQLTSGASNNVFEDNIIHLSSGSNLGGAAIEDADTFKNEYNVFLNNHTIGGAYGIILLGGVSHLETGNIIKNNIIDSFTQAGVYTDYQDSFLIYSNRFFSNSAYYGIKINNTKSNGNGLDSSLLANNFIVNTGNLGYGLYVLYSTMTNIYNNNISISSSFGNAIYVNNNTPSFVNLVNNIFYCKGNGAPIYEKNITRSDYNVFCTTTGSFSLSNYRFTTGTNKNSRYMNPNFYNDSTNLHVRYDSLNKGIFLNSVPDDIDGQKRRIIHSTIGADEIALSSALPQPVAAFSNTPSTCIGDSTKFTDNSTFAGIDTIVSWSWNFGDGNTSSSQNPKHLYLNGGSFKVNLIVTTKSGASDTSSNTIFIDSTCVWPGDANANKIANTSDVLSIGVAYGDTGALRPLASTSWMPQSCKDWADTFTNGINYKYADCNGDGIVDSLDVSVVSLNYGRIHLKKSGGQNGGPNDPVLSLVFSKDSFSAGDKIPVTISFGTSAVPAKNVYGVAFKMSIDSHLVDTNLFRVDVGNSWLGDNASTIHLVKEFRKDGYADVAICRIDHKDISGYGNIGTVSIVIKDDIAGKKLLTKVLKIKISDAVAIEHTEKDIPLNLGADSAIISQYLGINENKLDGINSILVYPNPAMDAFIIEAKNLKCKNVSIVNLLGKTIWESDIISGQVHISTVGIPEGIYFLRGTVDNKIFNKKIIIQK